MTRARREQINLHSTPYYHCVTRCVRRAFLCGKDRVSGRSFDHRKSWIVNKLKFLTSVFAVDLCAYAVMSNHYHVVVRVDGAGALCWSDKEVAVRWMRMFCGHPIVDRYLAEEVLSAAEQCQLQEVLGQWRARLYDLSWFMRCVNEPIARLANQEDNCRGRFWEGRFKCQALLDDTALVACMTYVDLNPVRAGIAATLEQCDYASVQDRLRACGMRSRGRRGMKIRSTACPGLLGFQGDGDGAQEKELPFEGLAYLELVEWTGRAIRQDKAGHIPDHIAPLLERLQIDKREWVSTIRRFGCRFHRVIGAIERMYLYSERVGRRWLKGLSASRLLYERAVN